MTTAETLNAVGRWLVPFLVQLSLELAVLAGIVVALLFALRVRSPRLRSAFWAMVLAKPVVSLLIASPVSLYGFLQPAALAPPVLPARMVSVTGQRPPLAVPADLPQSAQAAPPVTPALPAWWEGLDRYGAASLLWGAVTACLALRLFLGMAFVTFLRRTAAWQRAGPLAAVARTAAQTLGLRQPLPVALSTVPRGPVLAGLFRPAALLPAGLAQQLSEDQLLLIVAHESVHARHRDNLLLLLRRLAESLLFFHPVVWLSGSALGREVESACDEAVVAAFGARATYAGALVEVAALARHAGPAPVHHLLLTTFAASESGFGRRVRRVLHGRHRPMPYGMAVAALVALAVVGTVGLPRARGAASPDATNTQHERSTSMTPNTDQDVSPTSPSAESPASLGTGAAGATPEADPVPSLVLEGVPKVGFGMVDGNVELTPFPACMRAILEYLGDDLGLSQGEGFDRDAVYAYLMGTTGAAFRLNWNPGWHGDNVASWLLSDDPGEIFRRGFTAAGYEQISAGHGSDDQREASFRRLVMESLRDRRRPLIAHGVIGPPEEAIIAGYGEGGATVMGWSFFQDDAIGQAGVEFLPNGYFRKRQWVANTWSLIAFGDKIGNPPRRETCIEALKWALHVSRDPVRYGARYSGLAAYEAWAEQILRDDEVAAGGGPDDAFMVHSDAVDVVAEGRHYAEVFLKQAAGVLPEVKDELLAAAQCYRTEHDLMWQIWGVVGGNQRGAAQKQAFLQPELRRRIAVLIRQAQEQDAVAGDHLERALRALGEPGDQIAPPPPAGLPELPRKWAPHLLQGLEFPKWAITELGCTHACLTHLGVKISRAWLYGGTARAFLINIHEDVDVEAVTAFRRERLHNLSSNLGFRVEGLSAEKEVAGDQYLERQREAWTFVRSRLSRGVPCYGWELKPPYGDYWLITGFDDVGYFYAGWETGGPTPWQKLGDQFIPVLDVRSLEPCPPASDAVVVREAFRTAIWLAEHPREWTVAGDAHGGPEAYEAWAASLEVGKAIRNHHAYNAWAWHETREMAVAFLEEAKARLNRADLAPLFDAAIKSYSEVREALAATVAKYPMPTQGWDNDTKTQDGETAAVLRRAGQAERKGLAVLGKIAAALN